MERRVITVFGGSGLVGRCLVQKLAADGWIVRAAVRRPGPAAFLKMFGDPGQVVPVAADVTDRASVAGALTGAEAAINLVGILFPSGRRFTFQKVHVEGAAKVAQAAREAGVGRLVHMSAIGADSESPAEYARTKAGGEQAVLRAFPGASIVRPSIVFGPEDAFFNKFAGMSRFSPILPVFETKFQPVYVGDVADAFLRILADPSTAGKTFELGGPRVVSFRQCMELMLHEIGRDRLLLPLPLRLAEIQGWFLEKLPTPPLTRDQVKLLGRDNVVSPGALTLKDLGIEATDLEAVLPSYLDRYRPQAKRRRASV